MSVWKGPCQPEASVQMPLYRVARAAFLCLPSVIFQGPCKPLSLTNPCCAPDFLLNLFRPFQLFHFHFHFHFHFQLHFLFNPFNSSLPIHFLLAGFLPNSSTLLHPLSLQPIRFSTCFSLLAPRFPAAQTDISLI